MNTNFPPPVTLESVQQAFAHWRQARAHKRSRIPQALLEQAAAAGYRLLWVLFRKYHRFSVSTDHESRNKKKK